MKAAQVGAWLICLVVAFLAFLLAVRNGVKGVVLERRLAHLQEQMVQQESRIEDLSRSVGDLAVSVGQPPQPAVGALWQQVQALRGDLRELKQPHPAHE